MAILTASTFSYSAVYTITQLTDNSYNDHDPQINNNGYVVWGGAWPWTNTDLFLYDGSDIKSIPSYPWYYENAPQINNNGYVTWWGYKNKDNRIGKIFLYDGSTTIPLTPITDDYYNDNHKYPQINDNGYVAW